MPPSISIETTESYSNFVDRTIREKHNTDITNANDDRRDPSASNSFNLFFNFTVVRFRNLRQIFTRRDLIVDWQSLTVTSCSVNKDELSIMTPEKKRKKKWYVVRTRYVVLNYNNWRSASLIIVQCAIVKWGVISILRVYSLLRR